MRFVTEYIFYFLAGNFFARVGPHPHAYLKAASARSHAALRQAQGERLVVSLSNHVSLGPRALRILS